MERENVLSQTVLPIQKKEVKQEQQIINPNKEPTYNIDEFKQAKPTGKIDFSQPIDKSLLMENINEGMEDNNFSNI